MILGRHSVFFISLDLVSYFISILPYFSLATITERPHVSDNLIETEPREVKILKIRIRSRSRSSNFKNFIFEVEVEASRGSG